jgi:magnesium transporter
LLINCVAYQQGTKLADIQVAQISDYLARPDCFVWVALKDASDAELLEMQHEFHLHDLAIEDARHGHQRPKIEEYGDTVFTVMHTIEYSPTDALTVGEVCVFVGPNFVLSVRSGSTQGFLGVRARAEREPHLLRHGSSFVFYALMDAVVDRYFPVNHREPHLRARHGAPEHRAPVRAEAPRRRRAPCRGAADGSHQQALRRPRAAGVPALAGLLPRCL